MVNKHACWLAYLFVVLCAAPPALAVEEFPDYVSADSIRLGCSVSLSKLVQPAPDDPLSVPPHDVVAVWVCKSGEKSNIDRFEANGGSPEVIAVTYWRHSDVIILVKWSINSRASDYVGDYYKVFAYKQVSKAGRRTFVRDEALMREFPEGVDGSTKSGLPLRFPFKDADAIKRHLVAIQFDKRFIDR